MRIIIRTNLNAMPTSISLPFQFLENNSGCGSVVNGKESKDYERIQVYVIPEAQYLNSTVNLEPPSSIQLSSLLSTD